MPSPNPLLSSARAYAEKYGWAVIPVRGKESASRWKKYQQTRPNERQLIGLFTIANVTGLAVVLGGVSAGLRVRDFDVAAAYHTWAEAHPDLAAELPTSKTGRGYHVFFRADVPDVVTDYGDGELRAGNGYAVLPPSAHPDGGSYVWLVAPAEIIPFVADVGAAGLSGVAHVLPPGTVPSTVEDAITKTLPTGAGERTRKLWAFARRLKGITGLDVSPGALLSYVRAWHGRALPFIKTTTFEVTELAFYDAWTNSEVPLTDDQFLACVRPVLDGPDPDWLQAVFLPQAGKRLLRVCAFLQERAGGEPFFLAARAAGAAVGVDPTYAGNVLKRLVGAGYLEVVEKGRYGTGLATTWRFKGPAADDQPKALAC